MGILSININFSLPCNRRQPTNRLPATAADQTRTGEPGLCSPSLYHWATPLTAEMNSNVIKAIQSASDRNNSIFHKIVSGWQSYNWLQLIPYAAELIRKSKYLSDYIPAPKRRLPQARFEPEELFSSAQHLTAEPHLWRINLCFRWYYIQCNHYRIKKISKYLQNRIQEIRFT